MTGQGPRKPVDAGHASARLLQAREFHESARSLVTLGESKSYNGAVTLMVTAVIAYTDAITAKGKGIVNKQDHLNYGARSTALEEAQRLLVELDEFAVWAEGVL